jgi:hypothetical protein
MSIIQSLRACAASAHANFTRHRIYLSITYRYNWYPDKCIYMKRKRLLKELG